MSDRHDYYRQYGGRHDLGDRGGGAAYAVATAIRWIGIIIVTLIAAYVVLRITGSIEGIFFSSPESP